MRINVIKEGTGLHLFDYKSSTIPRVDEAIQKDEDEGMVVTSVIHKITKDGEPYVNIYVDRM